MRSNTGIPVRGLPALHHELPVDPVERRDHAVPGQASKQRHRRGGADDDPVGSGIQPAGGNVVVPDSAAHPAGREVEQGLDERTIRPSSPGRVEIDERRIAGAPEALGERTRVAGGERALLPPHELHAFAALDVDGGNDHCRTSTPHAPRYALVEGMLCSP